MPWKKFDARGAHRNPGAYGENRETVSEGPAFTQKVSERFGKTWRRYQLKTIKRPNAALFLFNFKGSIFMLMKLL